MLLRVEALPCPFLGHAQVKDLVIECLALSLVLSSGDVAGIKLGGKVAHSLPR
ncbi:hypothetical protein D3C87_1966040 [compost metagenome]